MSQESLTPEIPLIRVPKRLKDENDHLRVWEFCAPTYIAPVGTGTLIGSRDAYQFGHEKMTRSATLTFVQFDGRYFAVTCRHVMASLESANSEWRIRYEREMGSPPTGDDIYYFFTPVSNRSIHFKFKLWGVPETSPGFPDVAIAEVSLGYISCINRFALKITKRLGLPTSAIATGYPEQQRNLTPIDEYNDSLSTKAANCFAYLTEQNGRLVLSDSIDENHGLDNLSGMSGGPIIWSDPKSFGLLGIVTNGLDIIPKDSESDGFGIAVFGEPISYEMFKKWVSIMPSTEVLADKSVSFITPNDFPKTPALV